MPLHDPLKGSLHLTFCPLFPHSRPSYMSSFPRFSFAFSAFFRVSYSACLTYRCTFVIQIFYCCITLS